VDEFDKILGSKEPAPGGGSVSSLSGMLGASLVMMVANVSFEKKSYAELSQEIKDNFVKDFTQIKAIKEELKRLVDEDALAFNKFMEILKLPKDTEEENAIREEKKQEARVYTLQVPLRTAENCLKILECEKCIASYGNKTAVSDIGVGSLLALSGLEGAILNVKINIPSIKDNYLKESSLQRCNELLEEGRKIHGEVMSIVESRIQH